MSLSGFVYIEKLSHIGADILLIQNSVKTCIQ